MSHQLNLEACGPNDDFADFVFARGLATFLVDFGVLLLVFEERFEEMDARENVSARNGVFERGKCVFFGFEAKDKGSEGQQLQFGFCGLFFLYPLVLFSVDSLIGFFLR